jgi:hypothetical protein
MFFLWWLLQRMNEVPDGRIIQTRSRGAAIGGRAAALASPDAYRLRSG